MVCVEKRTLSECKHHLQAIQDTLDILGGKWKITIMGCLGLGEKRFTDMQREINGIGPKMLSKELHELELNGLVQRTVINHKPLTVLYRMTEYGLTLKPVIHEMASWGKLHRKRIMSQ